MLLEACAITAPFEGEKLSFRLFFPRAGVCKLLKMATERKSIRTQLTVGEVYLRAIDDWRRRQPVIPSRSEAIRRLIRLGIAHE